MFIFFVLLATMLESTETVTDLPDYHVDLRMSSQTKPYPYGVEFCVIPKTGSMITTEILCDLLRDYREIPYKHNFGKNISGINACVNNTFYPDAHLEKWKRSTKIVRFTIVRDPIERFASYYGHFCGMLNQCEGKDIHQYSRWMYFMLNNKIKPKTHLTMGRLFHGYPQSWFCNLGSDKEIQIIRYTHNKKEMAKQFLRILKKAKVPKKLAKRALKHLKKSSTVHAAKHSERQKLREQIVTNPTTMEHVRAIYHDDFELFNKHSQ
ncbi:unnamed protein product, partial [Mesorhabditis belari]|uniref:Sulfotransferase family protein n=1 Tax=Mesorhabditis belari TaxID=2138241 RepID=A0AAF3ERT7_9BILA